jgi:hypothetical protein
MCIDITNKCFYIYVFKYVSIFIISSYSSDFNLSAIASRVYIYVYIDIKIHINNVFKACNKETSFSASLSTCNTTHTYR